MLASITRSAPTGQFTNHADGDRDTRLIFGVPYQAGDRTVIPVAELLDGAGPDGVPRDAAGAGLIQERALGLIEVAGGRADYRPITTYRRSAVMGLIVLAFMAIAVLLRSRVRARP
jgi:hypothetical protein